jgi:tetratricopeptide (TPR) repeat protein
MKYIFALFFLFGCSSSIVAQVLKTTEQEQLLEYYQSQRYDEATRLLKRVFGDNPEDLKATAMLAYASNMAGDFKIAEAQYLKLNQADSKNLAVLFNLAGFYAKRGNEEKARGYYRQVLSVDSNNFRALKLLASSLNDPIEKMEYLAKANQIRPTDGDVAYDLAGELSRQKQLTAAYQVLSQAWKADTSNYMLLKAKLPLCITLKKLDEAQEAGEMLLLNGDSSSFVINSMGKLAMEKKDFKKAISLFKVLEGRIEATESSLYYTAICYEKLKDLKNARAYTTATIDASLSPNVGSYYTLLAYLHEQAGSYKSAQAAYLKALQFSTSSNTYYSLGLLNDFKLKDKLTALRYYRKYLKSNPDEKLAEENRSYVKGRVKALAK